MSNCIAELNTDISASGEFGNCGKYQTLNQVLTLLVLFYCIRLKS